MDKTELEHDPKKAALEQHAAAKKERDAKVAEQKEANNFYKTRNTNKSGKVADMTTSVFVETTKDLVKNKDGSGLIKHLDGITVEAMDQIASDEALMRSIMALDKDYSHPALDLLYAGIKNVELFKDVMSCRFGVTIGAGKLSKGNVWNEKYGKYDGQWTVKGLLHVYHNYMRLPQEHLDKLVAVVAKSSSASGGTSGAAHSESGVYYISYNENAIDTYLNESSGATEDELHGPDNMDENGNPIIPFDSSEDLLRMDKTTVHELGHVIDYTAPGGRYSLRPDFLSISGWKSHGKDPVTVVGAIKEYMDEPMAKDMHENEKSLATLIAERMVQRDVSSSHRKKQVISDTISEKCKVKPETLNLLTEKDAETIESEDQKFVENNKAAITYNITHGFQKGIYADYVDSKVKNDGLRDPVELAQLMMNLPLLNHIVRATEANSPWYHGERFKELSTRQIHEGYNHEWFSYDNAAWDSGKISLYQYREPCEEFAELYASYHVAEVKGSHTPTKLKEWFEANGLDHGYLTKKEQKAYNKKLKKEEKARKKAEKEAAKAAKAAKKEEKK